MLIVISPAKKLDYEESVLTPEITTPELLDHSQELINILKPMNSMDIAELMDLSSNLSELNFERYQTWKKDVDRNSGKQALLAFQGDVYTGINAKSFSQQQLFDAQRHLRILSGLYGILKPLDLMRPYRLEMGTKLQNERGKNLYEFWGDIITNQLNKDLQREGSGILINLASTEYFKSVKQQNIHGNVITPEFKELKNGEFKTIGVHAKKARGLMTKDIIIKNITDTNTLKNWKEEGYTFNESISDDKHFIFTR